MNSPQGNASNNNKWVMSILEPFLDDDVGVAQPGDLFWSTDHVAMSGSADIDPTTKEIGDHSKISSKKRPREESGGGPGSKACREKMRRDRLNDRFIELSSVLEPGRPLRTDKASILADAKQLLIQLRADAQRIRGSNEQLQETIKELKAEKNELRDEKLRLKSEKERLEQQLKAITLPAGFLHPAAFHAAAAAAFAAQSHASGNKTMSIPGFSGMPMWQWMPQSVVDTSQDHVLRPPVA